MYRTCHNRAGGSQHPDAIFAIPAVFSINLPKLSFISCDQDGDRSRAFLRISNQFHDVALRDRILSSCCPPANGALAS
jgi:hypothetical protein